MVRHVFLSFVAEDLDLVNLFRGQARNRNSDLAFDDYSVRTPYNSTSAAYVRSQIKERIRGSSVLICLIGYTTRTSQWVEWEVATAAELGKRIIGVRLHSDSARDRAPAALTRAGAPVLDWDIASIIRAVG